jgi:GAF domain-containing protein
LPELFQLAVERVADTLEVDYCQIFELQPDSLSMLLAAGAGWEEGIVGRATVGVDTDSQAGYTLQTKGPVIVRDQQTETRFKPTPLLLDHGIVSGVSVVIEGEHRPFGTLGAHVRERREFAQDDLNFLQAIANTLSAAISRQEHEALIRELSAPVLPIADRVLLVPVVGDFDADRIAHLESRLLNAVYRDRAKVVVLDLTGAPTMNREIGAALARAVQAMRLLGAKVIMTGVSPGLSGALAREGIPEGVETLLDLRQGILAANSFLAKRKASATRA